MGLSAIDTAVVIVYAIGIFVLAQLVSRERPGHKKDAKDYFLAGKALPWWAIGSSLIAANISAEQIIGMSGSGYAIGLAIASYEWMAAATLIIVAKFIMPAFLRNKIYTMPQFLEERYGTSIRTLMAVFWLGLYIFVNLTAILWLGSLAISSVTGLDQMLVIVLLGVFALTYQLYGGLKAVALTDVVQTTLLIVGGLAVTWMALSRVGGDAGPIAGFVELTRQQADHFDMILSPDNPYYKDLPGLSVLIGGMWMMNLSYWGFNQYIIQRALAAKDIGEAQKGILFAAFLKLLIPVIVVIPGIAAVSLAPSLDRPDQAYPSMMALLPAGLLGLVFAALIAAIVSSLGSMLNSISTIFTLDFYAKRDRIADYSDEEMAQRHLVTVGRIVSSVAIVIAIFAARPLLSGFEQGFQYIQEYTGFFTPGIVVIFLLGLFWKKASEAGAMAAALGSFGLSVVLKLAWPDLPFMDRVGLVFLLALALAVGVSLARPVEASKNRITTEGVSFATPAVFNIGSIGVIAILVALYAIWW
jgi:SSS family solute:Na+ symporter